MLFSVQLDREAQRNHIAQKSYTLNLFLLSEPQQTLDLFTSTLFRQLKTKAANTDLIPSSFGKNNKPSRQSHRSGPDRTHILL